MYDTKCIFGEFESGIWSGTRSYLNLVYDHIVGEEKFFNNLVIKFDEAADSEFNNYSENTQHHDAGYDSYMTGYIFAMMTKRLEIESLLKQAALKKAEEESKAEATVTKGGKAGKKKGKAADGPQVVVVQGD